jgi:hypothetical protein
MSIYISQQNEVRLTEAAQREGVSVDVLIERLMNEHGDTSTSSDLTGAVVLAALQASPYRDIDLAPPRVPLAAVRDVEL